MQFWSQGSWQLTVLSPGWLAGHGAPAHSSGSAPSMGQKPTFSSAQRQTCTSSQTQQLAKKIQTSICYKLKTCELNCFHWEKNLVDNIESEVADRYLKFAEETKFQLTQVTWKSSLSSTTPIHPWLENFSVSQPRSCWRMGKKDYRNFSGSDSLLLSTVFLHTLIPGNFWLTICAYSNCYAYT